MTPDGVGGFKHFIATVTDAVCGLPDSWLVDVKGDELILRNREKHMIGALIDFFARWQLDEGTAAQPSREIVYWFSDFAGRHRRFGAVWRLLTIDYFYSRQAAPWILGSMTFWSYFQLPLPRSQLGFLDYPTIDYSLSSFFGNSF